jgi:hypothetical protein
MMSFSASPIPATDAGEDRLYSFEIEAAGRAIAAGRHEFASPGMSWADSLGNMRTLDRWRADAGM